MNNSRILYVLYMLVNYTLYNCEELLMDNYNKICCMTRIRNNHEPHAGKGTLNIRKMIKQIVNKSITIHNKHV